LDNGRRGVLTHSDKGKATSYNGSSEEGGLGKLTEQWRARFVTENDSSDGEDRTEGTSPPEDPFAADLSKEKFWGRIAVIGLGVSILFPSVKSYGLLAVWS